MTVPTMTWAYLQPALPEMYLTAAICVLLLADVFFGQNNKRFTPTFTLILLAGGAVLTAFYANVDQRLVLFGDSYSDIGAGYIDGNGPTAVAYLGWLMGLQMGTGKVANPGSKSLVFAVSGAGTGEGAGRQVKDALLGYGMMNQVRDFAARVKSGEIAFAPQTTLFFLAGGLNDGRRETAFTLANIRQQLQILRDLGGRHFTIARLPTKIPQFAAVGAGTLSIAAAIERAVSEGVSTFDFLGGGESYKYQWNAVDQPRWNRHLRRTGCKALGVTAIDRPFAP